MLLKVILEGPPYVQAGVKMAITENPILELLMYAGPFLMALLWIVSILIKVGCFT